MVLVGSVMDKHSLFNGTAYEIYKAFCYKLKLRPLTRRAFSGLVQELDMYGFVRVRCGFAWQAWPDNADHSRIAQSLFR